MLAHMSAYLVICITISTIYKANFLTSHCWLLLFLFLILRFRMTFDKKERENERKKEREKENKRVDK